MLKTCLLERSFKTEIFFASKYIASAFFGCNENTPSGKWMLNKYYWKDAAAAEEATENPIQSRRDCFLWAIRSVKTSDWWSGAHLNGLTIPGDLRQRGPSSVHKRRRRSELSGGFIVFGHLFTLLLWYWVIRLGELIGLVNLANMAMFG
jgi:hypothetical protein